MEENICKLYIKWKAFIWNRSFKSLFGSHRDLKFKWTKDWYLSKEEAQLANNAQQH